MTQMEILKLAQDELLHHFDLAQKMVQAKPCDATKEHRDSIMIQCMELRRMILDEHKKCLATAEQEAQQHMQAQQRKQTQQSNLTAHDYKVKVTYRSGTSYEYNRENLEQGIRTYNYMKDLARNPIITRVVLLDGDMIIRDYERNEF